MASASRLREKIGKARKARDQRPRPVVKTLTPVRPGVARRLLRENLGVLYAIEATLVRCWRQDDRIDDAIVNASLRSVLLEDPLPRMPEAWLFVELLAARESCQCDDEQTWIHCLRMVKESVQLQSSLQPRDCSYLETIELAIGLVSG